VQPDKDQNGHQEERKPALKLAHNDAPQRPDSATAGQRRMKTKNLKRKLKAQPGGSLEPVGSEIRWVIVGRCGLYEGQWQRRREALRAHTADTGRDWPFCRRQGDRAVKARIMFPNDHHQRWELTASDVGIATDLNGWLPSAAWCGYAAWSFLGWNGRGSEGTCQKSEKPSRTRNQPDVAKT